MIDNMYPEFMPDYGNNIPMRGFLPAFGQAAGKIFLQSSQWPYNSGSKEVTYNLFHAHGGAFLQVFTEVPQNLAVTHNPIIYSGESSFSVIAPEGAFISLTVNGEIIGTAMSNGGTTNITIEPQLPPNTMVVTVTKQNYYRYESNVDVIPPTGPYVVGDSYVINDASGNNNGLMDYGESVMLHMTMKNVGVAVANNVSTTMTSNNEYVTITNGNAYFGNIAPNGTVTVNNAFSLTVSPNIPDNHAVSFTLNSTDGTDNWISYISIVGHAPNIKFKQYVVNDEGGNGNGLLDPGETAPMIITVENQGSSAAYNVVGMLTTLDPYVTILTSQPQNMGNINAGGTSNCTFTVSANANIPAGYTADLTLNLNADLGVTQQTTIQLLFPDYCYPTASCSWGDGFTGFALEQINNMTGNGCSPNGYGDYTNMVADLEGGQTYSVQWRTGYSNQRASLWIDLNDNKEFEPSERLITDFVLSSSNQIYTTTFTVPAGSYTGNKRIRIRANWQSSSSDPCSNFTYGETEDYTANFGSQTTLAPPQNVSANVTGNSVVVTWQAPAGADATLLGYNVYRDNQKISNTITSLTYTDTNVPTGSHWYSVCAVYTEGESELAQPVQVNVGSLQGKLQGFIRNAVTNAVIQNAWVSALDSDFGAVTYNTIFGSHYTLYLSAGTYSVSCTAPGFQTLTVNNVVILEGQTKALNFYLHSSSESNLGGEVTGVSYFEFEDFSVYPNPASSEINITTTSAMKHVKIMNNMGQVVFVDGGGDLLIRVNTSGFSRGIYFIEVETENHRFFEKLIIN
jgi:hypothetical protein